MESWTPFAVLHFQFPWRTLGVLSIFGFFFVDYLFRHKKLPRSIALWVGRLWFYPTLPITFFGEWVHRASMKRDFITKIDDKVYLGGLPWKFLGRVDILYRLGIKGVVNMCDEFSGPSAAYKSYGITELRLPTVDHFEPSLEDITRAVEFIDSFVRRNEGVFIHCRGGHGRSAAVGYCWLLKSKGMGLEKTQEYLTSIRYVRSHLFQQKSVLGFYEQMINRK